MKTATCTIQASSEHESNTRSNFIHYGEIMLLALRSDSPAKSPAEADAKAMELRTLGEFTVRNRLLAVEGVSQVSVMGGILRQYQVLTSPSRLAARNVTLAQLTKRRPRLMCWPAAA